MKYSPYAAVFKYQDLTKSLGQGKRPYIVIESSITPSSSTIRKLQELQEVCARDSGKK